MELLKQEQPFKQWIYKLDQTVAWQTASTAIPSGSKSAL
jgi:hypothetical protein